MYFFSFSLSWKYTYGEDYWRIRGIDIEKGGKRLSSYIVMIVVVNGFLQSVARPEAYGIMYIIYQSQPR